MDIGKDWRIESDSMNATISKRKRIPEKDGVPEHDNWYPQGYFASPKHALNWLVNHKVIGTGMADLQQVVTMIDDLYLLIDGLANLPEIPRETVSATPSAPEEA